MCCRKCRSVRTATSSPTSTPSCNATSSTCTSPRTCDRAPRTCGRSAVMPPIWQICRAFARLSKSSRIYEIIRQAEHCSANIVPWHVWQIDRLLVKLGKTSCIYVTNRQAECGDAPSRYSTTQVLEIEGIPRMSDLMLESSKRDNAIIAWRATTR